MKPVAASGININAQSGPWSNDRVLKYSIAYFLRKYSRGVSDFPVLLSLLRMILLGQKDPPLDILWFFAAVEFHSRESSDVPPPGKLVIAKNQFKLLKYYTSECSAVKKVAVLAPVLYLLYNLDLNFSAKDHCLRQDISALVEEIFVYLSSFTNSLEEEEQCSAGLGAHILWSIKVWGVDHPNTYFMDIFFPILNVELREGVTLCLGNMAGVVLNETFLLRSRLRLFQETNGGYLQEEMRKLAVQTIKSFHNIYFLDLLYKILQELKLPAAASLKKKDAVILKSLYDAVILFDYSFYSGRWIGSLDSRTKGLAVQWVLLCSRAIRFSKKVADIFREISYRNAFNESQLVAELSNWASSEEESMPQRHRPNSVTPHSLIKWLLILEDHGIRVTESGSRALIHTKAATSALMGIDRTLCFLNNTTITGSRGKRKVATLSSDPEGSQTNNNKQIKLESSSGSQANNSKQIKLESSSGLQANNNQQIKLESSSGSQANNKQHIKLGNPVADTVVPVVRDRGRMNVPSRFAVVPSNDDNMEIDG